MRVDALMSTDLATVRPETDLRVAVGEMRSHDCGFLPVVDGGGLVVGVLTDRDVALALGAGRCPAVGAFGSRCDDRALLTRAAATSRLTRPSAECVAREYDASR